jgi:hypothetical protein
VCLSPITLPYIFMPRTHTARARPPVRTHPARTHAHSSLHTHYRDEWTVVSGQCRRRVYMRVSPRGHGNFQLFRVLPLSVGYYPSDMKVGNLLPACDWNMSSFSYRYYFRFWSFLLRVLTGAPRRAGRAGRCARVAPALVLPVARWFCPLRVLGALALCAAPDTHIHTYTPYS